MKKIFLTLCVLLAAGTAFGASQFYSPTELTYHNPDKAFQGYNLFHPMTGEQTTYLMDMNGEVVHTWPMDDDKWSISLCPRLYDDGTLLRGQMPQYIGNFRVAGPAGNPNTGSVYKLLDWDGNEIASVRHPDHKDATEAQLQAIFGLSDDQMQDQAAIDAAVAGMTPAQQAQIMAIADYRENHDARLIWNEALGKHTIMFIVSIDIPAGQVLSAGQDPELVDVATIPSYPNWVDGAAIVEMDIQTGEVIWEWRGWDHVIQNYDPAADNYAQDIADTYYNGDVAEAFYRRLDINARNNQGEWGLRNDWLHLTSFDYNESRDEVIFSSRSFSEIFIVDHSKTTEQLRGADGDFIWRFGSPTNYASTDQLGEGHPAAVPYSTVSDASLTQLYGSHDIHWIPEGLAGEGQLLIFQNGMKRPVYQNSEILQINPYDENGDYIRELAAGYNPWQLYPGASGSGTVVYGMANALGEAVYTRPSRLITWAFSSNAWNFFAPHASSAERQPNGNTLVCDGPNGHFFEVNPIGQVVWEYTSPLFGRSLSQPPPVRLFGGQAPSFIGTQTTHCLDASGEELIGGTGGIVQANDVFRVYRYAPDFPGLAGRDLTPKGTITGRLPGTFDQYPDPPPAPTGWGTSGLSSSTGGGGGGAAGGSSGSSGGIGY